MSTRSMGKSKTEYWEYVLQQFRKSHPGAFSDDEFLDWALEQNYVDLPRPNPRMILKREVKRALRAARVRDPQGRLVREMLPVKIEATDGGKKDREVVWDHIHEMSLDHALTTFDQRDININEQKQAASRDVRSCLDNNPNVKGHESQFEFDFMLGEPEMQVVETAEDSERPKPR